MRYRISFFKDAKGENLSLNGVTEMTYAEVLDVFRRLVTEGGYFETKHSPESTVIVPAVFVMNHMVEIEEGTEE